MVPRMAWKSVTKLESSHIPEPSHTVSLLFDAGSLSIGQFKLRLIRISGAFLWPCAPYRLSRLITIYPTTTHNIDSIIWRMLPCFFVSTMKRVQRTNNIFCRICCGFLAPSTKFRRSPPNNEIWRAGDTMVVNDRVRDIIVNACSAHGGAAYHSPPSKALERQPEGDAMPKKALLILTTYIWVHVMNEFRFVPARAKGQTKQNTKQR